jgi:small conductance mechanosensitive channel
METLQVFIQAIINHIPQIIFAVVILILGWWLAKLVDRLIRAVMQRRSVDITIALFISRFIYIAIVTFTIIAALAQIGVQTDSIVALIAASGLAVGLALRNTLSNLAAGILLIAFKPPFKVGDVVQVNNVIGQITDVHFLFTKIKNFENKVFAIPNGVLMSSPVVNFWANPYRVTDVVITISYEADLTKAKAVLLETARNLEGILKDPAPFVAVNGLTDMGVSIFARVAISNSNYDPTEWAFKEAIKLAFDEYGIEIAHRIKVSELLCAKTQ